MLPDRVKQRIATMTVSEICEREGGLEFKEKVKQKINDHNEKLKRDLVKSGIKFDEEEKINTAKLTKKKTGTIKKESVKVTTKIIKTPKGRAKSATKKPVQKAKITAKPSKSRAKSAVTAKAPKVIEKTKKSAAARKVTSPVKVVKQTPVKKREAKAEEKQSSAARRISDKTFK